MDIVLFGFLVMLEREEAFYSSDKLWQFFSLLLCVFRKMIEMEFGVAVGIGQSEREQYNKR